MAALTWCGPIAIKTLTGRRVRDAEMRTVDVILKLEAVLGVTGRLVPGMRGKTLGELPQLARAVVFYAGHVCPMVNGQVSNLNGYGAEPVNFVMEF